MRARSRGAMAAAATNSSLAACRRLPVGASKTCPLPACLLPAGVAFWLLMVPFAITCFEWQAYLDSGGSTSTSRVRGSCAAQPAQPRCTAPAPPTAQGTSRAQL
jgi:hypothetical protein